MPVSESAQLGQSVSQPALESVGQLLSNHTLVNQSVTTVSYTTLESVGQSVSHHMLVNPSVIKLYNP